MKSIWILEDFDYDSQCWVIIAMGDTFEHVRDEMEHAGDEYQTQCETRYRQIKVPNHWGVLNHENNL